MKYEYKGYYGFMKKSFENVNGRKTNIRQVLHTGELKYNVIHVLESNKAKYETVKNGEYPDMYRRKHTLIRSTAGLAISAL